jgi:hypothetical protein
MKTIIALAILAISTTAMADVYVNGYYRSNGTYVAPHVRSNPDSRIDNNYSYSPYKYGR